MPWPRRVTLPLGGSGRRRHEISVIMEKIFIKGPGLVPKFWAYMYESLFHEQGAIIIYKLKASNNNIALTATNAVNTSQAIACDVFTALVTAFVAVNAMFVP